MSQKPHEILFFLFYFTLLFFHCPQSVSLDKETHDTVMKSSSMGFSISVSIFHSKFSLVLSIYQIITQIQKV